MGKNLGMKSDSKFDIEFIKFISLLIFSLYLIATFFYDVRLYHNVLTFMRIIMIFTFVIFIFSIYENRQDLRLTSLGILLGIVGLYDLLSMGYANQIIILSVDSQDISIKLWTIARFIESISLLIVSLNIRRRFKLMQMFIIPILVLSLSLYIIVYTNILPDLWVEDIGYTNSFILIKYLIFILNVITICFNIFKTKIIGMKSDWLLIFIIMLIIISDIRFSGEIYEINLFNFIITSSKLLSYLIVFNIIKKKLFKSDYEKDLSRLGKRDILEYALKSSLEGTVIIGHNGEVLYCNDSFNSILGTSEKIKGIGYMEMIEMLVDNLKSAETFKQQVLNSIEAGENLVDNIYLKNGEVYKIRGFEFVVEGQNIGIIISCINITEAYKLEEILEDKEDAITNLKELESLRMEFLGNITHDFRTPITLIMSTIELWNRRKEKYGFDGVNVDFTKESCDSIKQNCFRLLKITNNLMDVTKISRNYVELTFENHNIVSLIEDIAQSVLNYSEQEGIKLVFGTNIEEKIIACHSDSIERIILNLLSNAIKFTPKGGRIDLNIQDKDDCVFISVKDNGIGIPKEMHKTIFDPFKQVENTYKRENEGSGIGLSLVMHLVEEHGGRIYINDKLDIGTEFIIELPVSVVDDKTIEEYTVNDRRLSIELSDI